MTDSSTRRAGDGAALDRLTRSMALGLGVATLVFAVLASDRLISQAFIAHPLWSVVAGLTVVGAPIAAAALSWRVSRRVIRVLLGTTAAGYLVALVALIPALPGGVLPDGVGSSWLFSFSVVAASAAAVATRPAIAWPYLVVVITLQGFLRVVTHVVAYVDLGIQEAVNTLLFDAVFVALAFASVRAGRLLDAAADDAAREARDAATARARGRERTRVESLIHDSVLVALLASHRGAARADAAARDALARLDDLGAAGSDEPLAARDWLWRLQSVVTDVTPTARFGHDIDETMSVPADVATGALEAVAEALRNSERHAGPASRAVHVRLDADGFEVTVLDDGRGFVLREVGAARLGIAVGIVERMRALPGGDAAIVSQPGVGTRVRVAWSRP